MKTKIAENQQEEIRLLRQEKEQISAEMRAYEIKLQEMEKGKQQMEEKEEKRKEEDKAQKEEIEKLNVKSYKLGSMLKKLYQEKNGGKKKQEGERISKRKLPKLRCIKAEQNKVIYIKQKMNSNKGQDGGNMETKMIETANI